MGIKSRTQVKVSSVPPSSFTFRPPGALQHTSAFLDRPGRTTESTTSGDRRLTSQPPKLLGNPSTPPIQRQTGPEEEEEAILRRKDASPSSSSPFLQQLISDFENVDTSDVSASKFCKPFPKAKAQSWHRIMKFFFPPLIAAGVGPVAELIPLAKRVGLPIPEVLSELAHVAQHGFGSEVGGLWFRYLTGPKKQTRVPFSDPSSEIVKGFVNSEVTRDTQKKLVKSIKNRLPRLCRRVRRLRNLTPNSWVSIRVDRLFPKPKRQLRCSKQENRLACMDFDTFTEIPGNIAGGLGKSRYGRDSRQIKGKVDFFRTTDGAGKTTDVRMRTGFRFVVKDAVDFCPLGTGDIGASIEEYLTVPLSRLEASGLANDVPFTVDYSGDPIDVTLDSALVRKCWSK